jgi:hypothetical protein
MKKQQETEERNQTPADLAGEYESAKAQLQMLHDERGFAFSILQAVVRRHRRAVRQPARF